MYFQKVIKHELYDTYNQKEKISKQKKIYEQNLKNAYNEYNENNIPQNTKNNLKNRRLFIENLKNRLNMNEGNHKKTLKNGRSCNILFKHGCRR